MKRSLLLIAIAALSLPSSLVAQPSTFTYQGQLKQAGAPATGPFNFEFRLFDALAGGNAVGSSIALPGVNVDAGLFTTQLNAAGEFGADAFSGAPRWLEINVNGTTLSPRQAITSAPYAITARNVTGPLDISGSAAALVRAANSGTGIGVAGSCDGTGFGLHGNSNMGYGVWGSGGNIGVAGFHLMPNSDFDYYGYLGDAYGGALGIHGATGNWGRLGTDEAGVRGYSANGIGLYGQSPSGLAGRFEGRVVVAGEVGIGTNTPSTRLDIGDSSNDAVLVRLSNFLAGDNSSAAFRAVADADSDPDVDPAGEFGAIGSLFNPGWKSNRAYAFANNATTGLDLVAAAPAGNLRVFTGGYDAPNQERMRIEANGNVGIGTESPQTTLDVNGTARVTGFQLPTAAQADYVLKSDAVGNGAWQPASTVTAGAGLTLQGDTISVASGGIANAMLATAAVSDANVSDVSWNKLTNVPAGFADGTDNVGGLTLPYSNSVFTGAAAFLISNTGSGPGLRGETSGGSTSAGVYGISFNSSGRGVIGVANGSPSAWGVLGQSTVGTGIRGESSGSGFGVYGTTNGGESAAGLYGISTGFWGNGVWGYAGNGDQAYGVYGESFTGHGVHGSVPFTSTGYGVYSEGRLSATGTKSFQIDHPLDPESKVLNHYCTESPEPQNAYNGVVALDATGAAWIDLPDYFAEINKDFRYQITCIGGFAPVYVSREIEGNRFQIAGGTPGLKVSWEVKGVRNDRFVRVHGAPVEQDKSPENRGKYLQPELYGHSKEQGQFYRPGHEENGAPEVFDRWEP